MSKLEFELEPLSRALDGHKIKKYEVLEIALNSKDNYNTIFKTSEKIRNKNKGKLVSFSKKSFFNIINLCRDTCTYCTYKSESTDSKLSMMEPKNVIALAKLAKKYHCTEGLLVTGERPEQKYQIAKDRIKKKETIKKEYW